MYEYFSLRITKDKMAAYLTVLYDKLTDNVTEDAIFDYIDQKNIIFGIRKDEIKKAVQNKTLISNLEVARGEGPSVNKYSFVDYKIPKECSVIPCADSDGTVDFNNTSDPVYVRKGDIICTIKMPEGDLKCKDIFGKSFVLSAEHYLPDLGPGVEFNKEDKNVYTIIDGCVDYSERKIDVMPVKLVKENIESGNYVGNLVIYSTINEDTHIKSDGHVIVCSEMTNSSIESGGSVVVRGNVQGKGRCIIKSERDIIANTISNMNLYCRRNICSAYLENCIAKAGRSVIATGIGIIESGRYTAGRCVTAKRLGSKKGSELIISIWDDWYKSENNVKDDDESRLSECKAELAELREQYMQLEKSLNTLKLMDYERGTNSNRANILRRIMFARAQVMSSISLHKKQHEEISEKIKDKKMEIACSGDIYRGVQFRIGQAGYIVPDKTSNRVFYLNGNDVFLYRQYK